MQTETISDRRAGTAIAAATAAVRDAAIRTGVDFSYLLTQARIESGLNAGARAATSSARGLFQFTAGTWLETVRRHGADHGLGWAADALASGAAQAGSALRATILSLRDNADAAALMAGELARDNGAALQARGHTAGPTELYMAHFLGQAGAAKFLSALSAAPDAAAAAVVPDAAASNRGVFFGTDGAPRSLAAVYQRFAGRFDAGAASPATGNALPPAGNALPPAGKALPGRPVTPTTPNLATPALAARAAYLLLAELGG